MGNWNNILDEIQATGSTYDVIRRKYLDKLYEVTGRNVIAFYSGWLQKQQLAAGGYTGFAITDADKNGLMTAVYKLDRSKGLDLILHTPGGDVAATESIVDYLRSMFGNDIRAIVPQLAMSCGTMIALSCKEVVMGKHSSLGPIDPQFRGLPAHGVIEEFERAKREIAANQATIPVWQVILSKYSPTFIGECENAMKWAKEMTIEWLKTGMFDGLPEAQQTSDAIVAELADHIQTKSHSRHISVKRAADLGIKVVELESDPQLQEAVLSAHHAFVHTFASTPATKVIENHKGQAYIDQVLTMAK